MGRSQSSKGGVTADHKPALVWLEHGKSFQVDQEATGLTDDSVDGWIAAAEEAFSTRLPSRLQGGGMRIVCTCADFSHNDLGDRGVEKIARLLLRRRVCLLSLRLFKNRVSDTGAVALAELLKGLPEPMEELHVAHNLLTRRGAVALLAAAAAAGSPAGGPPTWLRLENNCIEWDFVARHLAERQVRWAASETRLQAHRGLKRRGNAATAGEDTNPQVLVHRSYRHQAPPAGEEAAVWRGTARGPASLQPAAGPAVAAETRSASRSWKAKAAGEEEAAASGWMRYGREELLFSRQLVRTADGAAQHEPGGLRCIKVCASDSLPVAEAHEESVAQQKPQTLSLEKYLTDLRSPGVDDFPWNAKATEFVPTSPGAADGQQLNPLAAEFTPLAIAAAAGEFFPGLPLEEAAAICVADLAVLMAAQHIQLQQSQQHEHSLNPMAAEFRPGASGAVATGKAKPLQDLERLPAGGASGSTSAASESASAGEEEEHARAQA